MFFGKTINFGRTQFWKAQMEIRFNYSISIAGNAGSNISEAIANCDQ
jgi:hypothetical protein